MNPTYAVTQSNNEQNTEKSPESQTKNTEIESKTELTFTPEVINTQTATPINAQLNLIDPIIDSKTPLNVGSVTLGNDIIVLDTEIGFDLMDDLSDLGLDTEEGISVKGVDDILILTTTSGKSYTLRLCYRSKQ